MKKVRTTDQYDLLAGLYKGDEKSRNSLFKFFYPVALNLAKVITRNTLDAEEIALTTLHKLFDTPKNGKPFESLHQVRKFVITTTKNDCFTFLRLNKNRTVQLDEETERLLVTEEQITREIIQIEVASEVLLIIEMNLQGKEKEIFKLSFIKGYKDKEIATLLDANISTVKNTKANAVKKLRLVLNEWQLRLLVIWAVLLKTSF